ncbi:TPA: hypothetical protein RRU91_003852 [Klebsiella quasipneumoniae]|uniref:hypothetical protein n=1 Tax=Klebsiella quasipneumoniae TaxID=1463165 RepID=UPI000B959AF0|nr:hypothetical protein [Klebsiella quasipneumoniae]HBY5093599.1 hypothetical protein [Klebsiella pneumoniae]OYM43644.1 hypothetical protein CI754_03450 [Klebsiella quasipneumoniae subsp. similipneumoniae]GKQ00560.1 hypothetical protein NUKP74_42620 [Klebsiella quasipneumoniae]HBY6668842.1 hypothetical protein [Klebsiella pneumoniae]HCI5673001.1 hypothetical protein [Klebsiella quasipneumoniae subsp. similipneumoniae]
MNIKEIGNVFHCDCGFSWHRGKNGNHNCADGLREKVRQLAAENVALKSAITDHSHSVHFCEVCGKDDPCSTDDVCYALKDIPATDAYLAGIKADAITASLDACSDYLETDCVMDRLDISYEEAEKRTSGAIEFHDAMVDFANQLREGADK